MALPDLTLQRPWSVATSATEDKVNKFGDETDLLAMLIKRRFQLSAWRTLQNQVTDLEEPASFFLRFSVEKESRSQAFNTVLSYLAYLQSELAEDVLYEYKFSTAPKTIEKIKVKVKDLGKGRPNFHIDFEID